VIQVSNPDGHDVVEWAAVLTQFGGRQEFVAKLTGIALQAYADLPEKIAQSIIERDLRNLGFLAHSVKGICANFHAPKVLALAMETEKSAKDGNAAQALTRGEELVPLLRAMIDSIAAWRKSSAVSTSGKT
jgi:HPt (histidine-containing phosphotransfer) domain-containing protein